MDLTQDRARELEKLLNTRNEAAPAIVHAAVESHLLGVKPDALISWPQRHGEDLRWHVVTLVGRTISNIQVTVSESELIWSSATQVAAPDLNARLMPISAVLSIDTTEVTRGDSAESYRYRVILRDEEPIALPARRSGVPMEAVEQFIRLLRDRL